jgi:ribonuclease BN (tRNA processing enzyme)
MDLLVLGAGPAYTDRPGATGAAYLVRHGGTALLLDIGQCSFPKLAATLEPSSVDLVAISHLHPDHFIDLVPLRHYLRWQFHPSRHVRVVAPRGLAGRLDALHDEPGFTAAALDVGDLEPGATEVGTLRLEAGRVRHTADSFGFRVSVAAEEGDGRGLIYSGDCGAAMDLAPLIRPGDDLLVEASFGEGPVPPGAAHLDAPAIIELARVTRPGRILLTHIQMGHDPAVAAAAVRAGFDGEVLVAEPGLEVAVRA